MQFRDETYTRFDTLEGDTKELKTDVKELQTNVRALKTDVRSLQIDVKDLRIDVDDLAKGAFTEDEKADLMANVRVVNERLENDTLGKKDITLTRGEYDSVSLSKGFANRFN